MCICINCKWVDRCFTYHDVEHNHGVNHISNQPDFKAKKPFIHGQPVCLGIYVGSLMHNSKADEMLDYIFKAGVDIRPEAMNITWEDVKTSLINLKTFLNNSSLWHSIVHDMQLDEYFYEKVKDSIEEKYKNFKE